VNYLLQYAHTNLENGQISQQLTEDSLLNAACTYAVILTTVDDNPQGHGVTLKGMVQPSRACYNSQGHGATLKGMLQLSRACCNSQGHAATLKGMLQPSRACCNSQGHAATLKGMLQLSRAWRDPQGHGGCLPNACTRSASLIHANRAFPACVVFSFFSQGHAVTLKRKNSPSRLTNG